MVFIVMYISKLNFSYGMFSSNSFKLDRVILRDPSAGTVIPSYTDSYVIYDMQHMICLVNEIPKALKPPESAPMATSCSFINAKQIKTTNKS